MTVGGSNGRAEGGSHQSGRKPVSSRRAPSPRNGRLRFTFYSNTAQAVDIQGKILDAAQSHGFVGEDFFALRIAVEEGLINAMKHGNRMDPKKKVHVEARLEAGRAEITIEDEGPGFDRASVPDPTAQANLEKTSGRGILLIEAYMHDVKWDRGGRRLRMVRKNKIHVP